MSSNSNGHVASNADGEILRQHLAHLSIRCKGEANVMSDEDVCPVCKNSTYLQKNLRFKVNTKCYHRICEGCVDRITSSQKKCPIAGCPLAARGVIPRRGDYRVQTFADLAIEREVDLRKRVMAILNRREEEFTTKRAWDDFLEQREEMIMNLVLKTDAKRTEALLNKYKEANTNSIKANAAWERNEAARLQSDSSYSKQQSYPTSYTKSGASGSRSQGDGESDPSGLVKGLRRFQAPVPEKAYDPFEGMITKRDFYELRDDYSSLRLTKAKDDNRTKAGGFDFSAYFDESLLRAFAGFTCFIHEERAGQDIPTSTTTSSVRAAETPPVQ